MSKFAVGEVVTIVWLPGSIASDTRCERYFGEDVTVISLELMPEYCGVEARDGFQLAVTPENLRKRRPPQDWQTLCKLEEVPSDCVREPEVCV